MATFLQQVAQSIMEKHQDELDKVCLVTPNRRAALFLSRHFSSLATRPMWAPDVTGMEEFVCRITGLTISDPVNLLIEFYSVYSEIEGDQSESLEEFLKWAPVLLRDFNDIDAHVPEPEKLFANVVDVKNIESWNPDGSPPSEFQLKYIRFFERIKGYHTELGKHLKKNGVVYLGLAYRMAAEILKAENTELPWKKIYFTGFNALNQAEETIIRTLTKKGTAGTYWDADKYYLNNPNHEAGIFLRKYLKLEDTGQVNFIGDHFSIKPKKIQVYGVAKNVNQAKLAGNILATFPGHEIDDHNTAVVLANEELLLPMLNSIPSNVEKLNVTMGYPLRKTNFYSFLDAVFQLHITTHRMNTVRDGDGTVFYHKDVIRILMHPLMSLLCDNDTPGPANMPAKIATTKRPFLTFSAIGSFSENSDWFKERFGFLFMPLAYDPTLAINTFNELVEILDGSFRNRITDKVRETISPSWVVDFESLYPVGQILRKLNELIGQNHVIRDIRMLYMLFQAMARETKLPLSGEPLSGLQVMGMLETRNLDFKNLVILSANEDILPAAKSANTLIPFDIKARFGIPVYREKDAIYAYHFYRLLQRAENIHIIYNTQARDLGSSEKSRFITQLQMEMPGWNPEIRIIEQIIALPSAIDEFDHEIKITKSPAILQKLEEINEKGFSPSTLNHYIMCSLLFYFRHIAGISESEELEETMEARTLGIVIHETLEQLYQGAGLQGKAIKPEHSDWMLENLEKVMNDCFKRNYSEGDISTGKNLLLYKVAARYLKNFLVFEKENLKKAFENGTSLIYMTSEEQLKAHLNFSINGKLKEIRFRGFADRIDRLDEIVRVIDYKTGRVAKEELKVKEWPEIIENPNMAKSFQLMMYALLYKFSYPETGELSPGIYSLRTISSGLLTLTLPESKETITNEALRNFKDELGKLMTAIFDIEKPFIRTSEIERCVNCDFRIVCNRQ
jgi:ATP-dependent helicase/nuclease subunit B